MHYTTTARLKALVTGAKFHASLVYDELPVASANAMWLAKAIEELEAATEILEATRHDSLVR